MGYDKEYWEKMIGIVLLIFATYTITKDMVDEGLGIHLFPSNSVNAILNAGIFDILLVSGLNFMKKQRKTE